MFLRSCSTHGPGLRLRSLERCERSSSDSPRADLCEGGGLVVHTGAQHGDQPQDSYDERTPRGDGSKVHHQYWFTNVIVWFLVNGRLRLSQVTTLFVLPNRACTLLFVKAL